MDNVVEAQEAQIPKRDQVLSEVDGIFKIGNPEERKQKSSDFVAERLKSLTEASTRKEISLLSPAYKGFIHPESGIRRNFLVDPFHIDDPELYDVLLDTLGEFRQSPNWQGKSLREIVPFAVILAIGKYYGNYWAYNSTEAENQEFYMEHSTATSEDISLKELKGKGFAVCAEKASAAQNLLAFLGYDIELIASNKCRLESPEQDDRGGHMFNVISSESGHFIFDPTNPSLLEDNERKVVSFLPANYRINEDEYQSLIKGGQVEVTHNDGKWDGTQAIKGSDAKRIYGGPSQA